MMSNLIEIYREIFVFFDADRERERERETDRQTDRQTERQVDA